MEKQFIGLNEDVLVVENNKKNIIFKVEGKQFLDADIYFSDENKKSFVSYLEMVAKELWSDFEPKEAYSMGSDYNEYYDRKYDNNGYIRILKANGLRIERPSGECPYMYKFNKSKMQSFVFDLKNRFI